MHNHDASPDEYRSLAEAHETVVVPAITAIVTYGERSTGDLLVLSQVMLSLQLPFAIIPLIHFVSDRQRLGKFAIRRPLQLLAWTVALIIVALNVALVVDEIRKAAAALAGNAWIVYITAVPLSIGLAILLLYVTLHPWLQQAYPAAARRTIHGRAAPSRALLSRAPKFRRIAVALDFGGGEERLLAEALQMAQPAEDAQVFLLHVVESPAARALGEEAADREVRADKRQLARLATILNERDVSTAWALGAGDPAGELARMVNQLEVQLVIAGSHGHAGVSDLVHGTTIDRLRHRIRATLLVVPLE